MLRAEKLKAVSSVKIEEYRSNSKRRMLRAHQKGSILIGLIITMVIMASLGAGMLYVTTTSTFQELFANNNARAYYAAESGGRHALAEIRRAYSQSTTALRDSILATIPGTYTLGNSDSFVISSPLTPTGNPQTITFTSTGTVNSGFLQAKRLLSYNITPANPNGLGGTVVGPTGPINFSSYPPTVPSEPKLVIKTLDGGFGVDVNTSSGGASKIPLVLYNSFWSYTGDYDIQLKVAADGNPGTWHMGLFFNLKANGTAMPYGYGLTFYKDWGTTGLNSLAVPSNTGGLPVVLLWQHTNDGTTNGRYDWIAYATINDDNAIEKGILTASNGKWQLGTGTGSTPDFLPTILVKVIRRTTVTSSCTTPPCNEIRAYFGGPKTKGTADSVPENYVNRLLYEKWSSIAESTTKIKWPSFPTTSWSDLNDYFSMINSDNTSTTTPVPVKWVKNPSITTASFSDDVGPAGTIKNAVIISTILTGSDYSGVGLFMDATSNPKGDFYNLGILPTATGVSDGSGSVIVSP